MTTPQRGLTLDQWLAWFETVHPKRIDLRLDRFVAVLDTLGLRKPPYKVITVAGTNGKGSCVAMLES
ncbi:MAG TPA: bifunctional tetrahydrofolate synthase/dihydrofolate synthase, partial [Gammaproteobacteria bacterium]|nr:bifunctional tetrahydrofolate synthase/dihydrofolate synthase [Gammaproteobacteria bacterium]